MTFSIILTASLLLIPCSEILEVPAALATQDDTPKTPPKADEDKELSKIHGDKLIEVETMDNHTVSYEISPFLYPEVYELMEEYLWLDETSGLAAERREIQRRDRED